MRNKNGFTLIELIVVIGVLGVVSIIFLSTIVNTLRGTNKANITGTVRQNGNYALGQIARTIRTAATVTTPSLPCNASSSPTSSTTLSVVSASGSSATYVCTASPSANIMFNGNPLLDANSVTVTNCTFTCSQESSSDNPVVTIDFTLQGVSASKFAEQVVPPIEFKTSVILQNVGR